MDTLSLVDLFVVGLGLDLAGGYLLARGLIADNDSIRRESGTYWGANYGMLRSRVRDKVASRFGLGALATGFAVQGGAYVASIARGGASEAEGSAAAAVAALLGLGSAATVIGVHRLTRERLARRILIDIAHWDQKGRRHPAPLAMRLLRLGQNEGIQLGTDESPTEYVRRVWGVQDALMIDEDD